MRFLKIIFPFLFTLTLAAGLGYIFVDGYYNESTLPREPKRVVIAKGASVKSIALGLEEQDIIRYPLLFTQLAKLTKQTNLKHGEYYFSPQMSPKDILGKLVRGDVIIRKFTIPEGKTSYEILDILANVPHLTGDFPEDIPEGSVLPNTYNYVYGNTYEDVIKAMQKEMDKTLTEAWENRAENLPLKSKEEALILASIVEKETGLDGERGLVASVFTNRLRIPMRLESDPTAVYGITKGAPLEGGKVRAKHVRHASEYNTYTNDGLPPTPICAPGIEAIKAVMNPPETNYLFFVANGKGGHNFATSLDEHNKNVRLYRKAMEQAQ